MLIRSNQDLTSSKQHQLSSNLWKTFIGPLVAAIIAGAGAFVGMQREMSVVTNSVNRMTMVIDKIADKQTDFFERVYVPLALKVEQHSSIINTLQTNDVMLKDEIRYLHPNYGRGSTNHDNNRR